MQQASVDDLDLLRSSLLDAGLVFLDGFHAVKHAVRFDADIQLVVCASQEKLRCLSTSLAPDISERLHDAARLVHKRDIDALSTMRSHWTGVWGVARRPTYAIEDVLESPLPVVLLENPQNRGNIGACIRVAAAANVGGVLISGSADPWEPAVVRSAAGLQFALPVVQVSSFEKFDRPIVAVDPEGHEIGTERIPPRPILAFGTEREGLSDELTRTASYRLRIPMRAGVSSVNLAVAVGVVLYLARLNGPPDAPLVME